MANVEELNDLLEKQAYLCGHSPSQSDAKLFACAPPLPSEGYTASLHHFHRWRRNLSSFSERERSEWRPCSKSSGSCDFCGGVDGEMNVKSVANEETRESQPDVGAPPKTEAQKKKEAAKQAKLDKFAAKKAKLEAEKKQQMQSTSDKTKAKKAPVAKKEIVEYASDTKPGEKKDVACELPSAYSPKYVEAAWYPWWENAGFFKPEYVVRSHCAQGENATGTFTMVIPPPNVTGKLHLGHALTIAVEDAIVRWHRMRGAKALWVPGCDHAGIATQVVVEKKLRREKGLGRHDLGREKFVDEVWKWKNEKGDSIYWQLKCLGGSFDWSRACFTMDTKMCNAVTEAFVRLHQSGLIYRSVRLVNWSCALRSAISDIEVEKRELAGRTLLSVPGHKDKVEFGVIVLFAYPIDDSDEEVVVATTRLETMLGDTAVAVHPDDDRYKHLIGRQLTHPLIPGRKMSIIADQMVDVTFGTGAVKITPAHDHNDYEVGVRHGLQFVTCIGDDGLMTKECGQRFEGMKRFEARKAVLEALRELNLYRETKDNPMIVPICGRSKDVIEPILKAQWYVKCDKMAEDAINVVNTGELKLIPDMHVKTWMSWMENMRDWCISRQLWWGHRIPAYFVTILDGRPKGEKSDNEFWVSGRTRDEAMVNAKAKFGVDESLIELEWDEDVLDTWFSSALFPFSTMGWPEQTPDFGTHYPGNLLETGHDILFFWVARMVFFARALTGKLPFYEVYLHAMVRDAHGRKMSKSLGNVIDPNDVICGITLEKLHESLEDGNLDPSEVKRAKEGQRHDYPQGIPECGTDALRFALCAYTAQGRDINLDVLRVQGYRFFCNKLWQAAKFTLMQLGSDFVPLEKFQLDSNASPIDRWILSRLSSATDACEAGFKNYNFPSATTACYNFWLYELCDVYLEYVKRVMQTGNESAVATTRQTLYKCAETGLRLVAPFMPFISEELWQRLPKAKGDSAPVSICVARYPSVDECPWVDSDLDTRVSQTLEIVKTARSMRADYDLTNKTRTDTYIECANTAISCEIAQLSELIHSLANVATLTVFAAGGKELPHGCAMRTASDKCKVHLMLKGLIDVGKETKKLGDKISKLDAQLLKLTEAANMADYETKVPPEVRQANAEKQSGIELELTHLREALATLGTADFAV